MSDAQKKRILVVDDEPDLVIILEEFLQQQGFEVVTAGAGIQALEMLPRLQIDLVLLDIAMPRMNGIEILREMKKIKPDLPVIMITAYRDADKVVAAFRLGAFDCIFKPFDFKYLREAIYAKLWQ